MPVLEWRETARADLLAIVDYISDDNPDAAQRLKDDVEAGSVEKLGVPAVKATSAQGWTWDLKDSL